MCLIIIDGWKFKNRVEERFVPFPFLKETYYDYDRSKIMSIPFVLRIYGK